jgi:hypothetical protein
VRAPGTAGARDAARRPQNLSDVLLDVPAPVSSCVGEPDWVELAAQDRQYRSWAGSLAHWRTVSVLVWGAIAALVAASLAPLFARPLTALAGPRALFGLLVSWRTVLGTPVAAALATALLFTRLGGVSPPRAATPLGRAAKRLLGSPSRLLCTVVAAPLLMYLLYIALVEAAAAPATAPVAAETAAAAAAVAYTPLPSAMNLPLGDPAAYYSTNNSSSTAAPSAAYVAPFRGLAPGATVSPPASAAGGLTYVAPSGRLYRRACLAVSPDPTARGPVVSLAANAGVPLGALAQALPVAAAEVEGIAVLPIAASAATQLAPALALLLGLLLALRGALTPELTLRFDALSLARGRLARFLAGAPAALAQTARDSLLLTVVLAPTVAAAHAWLLPRLVLALHGGALFSLLPLSPSVEALQAEPASDLFAALLASARAAAANAAKAAAAAGVSESAAVTAAAQRVMAAAPAAAGGSFSAVITAAVRQQSAFAAALRAADPALGAASAADAALRARVFAPLVCADGHALFYVPEGFGAGLGAAVDALGGPAGVASTLLLLALLIALWHVHALVAHAILAGPLRFGRYLLKGLTDTQDKTLRYLAMHDLAASARFDSRARGVFFSRLDELPLWPGSLAYVQEQDARLRAAAQSALASGVSVAAFASSACLTSVHRTGALWRTLHDVLIERLIHNTTRKVYRHLFDLHRGALASHLALARAAAQSASGAVPPPLDSVVAALGADQGSWRDRLWRVSPRGRLQELLADHTLVAAAVAAATELVLAAQTEDVDNAVGAAQSAQALVDALAQLECALRDLEADPTTGAAAAPPATAPGLAALSSDAAGLASGAVEAPGGASALAVAPPRACAETALLSATVRLSLHRLLGAYRERRDEWTFAPAVAKHVDAYLRFEV